MASLSCSNMGAAVADSDTVMVKGLEDRIYEEWLRSLCLFSPKQWS